MKTTSGILAVGTLILVAGCGSLDIETHEAQLQPLPTCAAVEGSIRRMAVKQMNEQLDKALDQALLRGSLGCGYYGNRHYGYDSSNSAPPAGAKTGTSSQGGGGSEGAKQVSKTNNQVAGVDEADFIKNDNKYIYVVANKTMRIFKAWPANQTTELSKIAVDGEPKKLFVTKNRALVYSSIKATSSSASKSSGSSYQKRECTYGYNCTFTGDGNPTLITIYDISDRTKPKKVRAVKLSGSFINARRVGEAVYTVLSTPGASFPGLRYSHTGHKCGTKVPTPQIFKAFEALREYNRALIMTTPSKTWLPSIEDTLYANGKGTTRKLEGCGGFFKSSIADGSQFTTVLGLHITRADKPSAATIISRPGAVYASGKALYISVPRQKTTGYGWYRSMNGENEASTVHKFKLRTKVGDVFYSASGVVKGRVLNQFSMDEHNDYLRIATTSGRVPSPKVHSTLTVLRHSGATLKRVGQVDRLAPKEDIRSVRFAGDRGYVVTFKKTDPLFVFDLSNPNNPRTMAELKIPGYSTYMHMMDKNHLLTIGYDANDQGSFAWFTGVRFQIFDVSVITNPRLVHKMVIGTRGSSSAALNNHLAFNYFAPKNLLAVPMTVCESASGYGGSYGKTMSFSGLMVFDTTAAGGFKLRGKVAHPAGKGIGCSNWWTNAKSQVERSVIMDDYVFSVSRELIKVNHLNKLSTDIKALPLK